MKRKFLKAGVAIASMGLALLMAFIFFGALSEDQSAEIPAAYATATARYRECHPVTFGTRECLFDLTKLEQDPSQWETGVFYYLLAGLATKGQVSWNQFPRSCCMPPQSAGGTTAQLLFTNNCTPIPGNQNVNATLCLADSAQLLGSGMIVPPDVGIRNCPANGLHVEDEYVLELIGGTGKYRVTTTVGSYVHGLPGNLDGHGYRAVSTGAETIHVEDWYNDLNYADCTFNVTNKPINITPPGVGDIQTGGSDFDFAFTGGPADGDVTWSVISPASGDRGSFTNAHTGVYRPSQDPAVQSVTIQVADNHETANTDTLAVDYAAPTPLAITQPDADTIGLGRTDYTFRFTGGPADRDVTWSIVGSNPAEIQDRGQFTDARQGIYRMSRDPIIQSVTVAVANNHFSDNSATRTVNYGNAVCQSTFKLTDRNGATLAVRNDNNPMPVYPGNTYRINIQGAFIPQIYANTQNNTPGAIVIDDHKDQGFVTVSVSRTADLNQTGTLLVSDGKVPGQAGCSAQLRFQMAGDKPIKRATPAVLRLGAN